MLTDFDLEKITILFVMQYLLIFCRIGSSLMLFPGISEGYVTPQVRLIIALLISLILLPVIGPSLPQTMPNSPVGLFITYGTEILIGLFIGAMIRLTFSLIHVAGMIIAFQSSLSSAMLFDPNQGSQGAVVGVFMVIVATTLIFTTNLHHTMLLGIAGSYNLFPAGIMPEINNMAEAVTRLIADGFKIAFQIAAPVTIVITIMFFSAGIMSRLMPTMQVFFVIVPLQLAVALILTALTLSATMLWYMSYYKDTLAFLE